MAGRRDWTRERLAAGVRPAIAARSPARSRWSRTATRSPTRSSPTSTRETGHAHAVGITGPPGVGKSSLDLGARSGSSATARRTVGVISVDPSSPFTQGALLGDRIRLTDHFLDPDVFIRSMGTRGHLGGLAETTLQALLVLDAARQGRRLPRDGRHRSERGGRALDRRHRRARADAGLGRLDPGAEGRDHGDPRRDRDQQAGPPDGEDDAERGAAGARARPAPTAGRRRSCSPRRSAARGSRSCGPRSPSTARGSRTEGELERRRRAQPRNRGVPGRLGPRPPASRADECATTRSSAACSTTCRRAGSTR